MAKLYDVVKAMGTYTDQNGQEKTRWMRCGMIIKNQNGNVALKLDAIPLTPPEAEGGQWFALMEPQQQGQQQGQGYPPQQQNQGPPPPPPQRDPNVPF